MNRFPKSLNFSLPEWKKDAFSTYKRAEQALKMLDQSAGKNSDSFNRCCDDLVHAVVWERDVSSYIKTPLNARAVTYLLATDESFAKSVQIDEAFLTAIHNARNPLSRLTLLQIIHAFFGFFNKVFSHETLALLAYFIKAQLKSHKPSASDDEISVYAKQAHILFAENGPQRVVRYAQDHNIDLDNALKKFELSAIGNTRFAKICQYHYYLETLRNIPIGEDHPILTELVKPDVTMAQLNDDGGLLGHEILRIMIGRCDSVVSDRWQSIVLAIAGDPRVPKTSANYRTWWAFLDEELTARVRGWLSKLDLSLFLEVLEQSAKDTGNTDMIKMFKPRRRFMEGLLNQGLVSETRLFLSSWATRYLKRHYDLKELPSYAEVASTQTSMIYLNLSGKVHMIEGSHSFKLNLFDRLPSNFHLTNYSLERFTDAELRSQPYDMYMTELNNEEGAQQFVHDSRGNWRHKAIEYFKHVQLEVDASQLMTNKEYRDHRTKFGI